MIERKFVNQNIKEFEIKEYIKTNLQRVGLSDVKLQRTPLGEKIVISTSRPGLVVGRSGTNITKLTKDLKEVFKLENPQIEIEEVTSLGLDANIIAEMIANSLERFGISRFKGIAHKAMSDVLTAGALGIEILISGKVPSARAKTWRFYQGYLKKCGDIAVSKIRVAYSVAQLKSGTVGVKVSIMTPDTVLPDKIKIIREKEGLAKQVGEVKDASVQEELNEKVRELTGEKAKGLQSAAPDKALPKPRKGKQESEAGAKKTRKEPSDRPSKKKKEQRKTPEPADESTDVASVAASEEEEGKNEI